jgi:hypothetical protein
MHSENTLSLGPGTCWDKIAISEKLTLVNKTTLSTENTRYYYFARNTLLNYCGRIVIVIRVRAFPGISLHVLQVMLQLFNPPAEKTWIRKKERKIIYFLNTAQTLIIVHYW